MSESAEKIMYEIGYLLLPSVAEENVSSITSEIIGAIEEKGGVMSYSELPKLRDLAHPISKSIERKHTDFAQAYFGWMRFEFFSPRIKEIEEIKKIFESKESVLRVIVIREPSSMLLPMTRRRIVSRRPTPRDGGVTTHHVEVTKEMDKEIDALIASTEEKTVV